MNKPELDFERKFPFNGATIHATFWSDADRKWSHWHLSDGRLQCENCRHVFEPGGDEVLPVFGLPQQPPTNYVCSQCRGLLKSLT